MEIDGRNVDDIESRDTVYCDELSYRGGNEVSILLANDEGLLIRMLEIYKMSRLPTTMVEGDIWINEHT